MVSVPSEAGGDADAADASGERLDASVGGFDASTERFDHRADTGVPPRRGARTSARCRAVCHCSSPLVCTFIGRNLPDRSAEGRLSIMELELERERRAAR
jgi:hypothetical protein